MRTFVNFCQEDFELLAAYIEMLDQLVLSTRMFKYQHVSCADTLYYIIACPRVACPFDNVQQQMAYPAAYCHELLELGWNLKQATDRFDQRHFRDFPDTPQRHLGDGRSEGTVRKKLEMKVGINAGPVACVVLGTCRRFYCVYGNTVNTAARMCSYAAPGAVCLSPDFVKLVSHDLRDEASDAGAGGGGGGRGGAAVRGERGHAGADEHGHAVAQDDVSIMMAHARGAPAHAPAESVTVPAMAQAELSTQAELRNFDCAQFPQAELGFPRLTSSRTAEAAEQGVSLGHGGGDGGERGRVAVTRTRSSITSSSPAAAAVRMVPLAATLEGPVYMYRRRGSSFSLASRGMHEIKGKGLMQLIDAVPAPLPASDCGSGGGGGMVRAAIMFIPRYLGNCFWDTRVKAWGTLVEGRCLEEGGGEKEVIRGTPGMPMPGMLLLWARRALIGTTR